MKTTILLFLLLCSFLPLQAQDYNYVTKEIFQRKTEADVELLKNTIENEGRQELIYSLIKNYKDYIVLIDEKDRKIQNLNNSFDKEYIHPDKTSNCKNAKLYSRKTNSAVKRGNQLKIAVSLAKTSYNLCKNNAYRTTNCSNEYNNYNRQVNLYNTAASKSQEYASKANHYQDKCNNYIYTYNDELEILKSKEKSIKRKYKALINEAEKKYKDEATKISQLISNSKKIVEIKYPNGAINFKGQVYTLSNKKTGKWKGYYQNGALQLETTYIDDLEQGTKTTYYENGKPLFILSMVKNKKEGHAKYYYENGKLKSEGNYTDDKETGNWKIYYETGVLKGEGLYKNGKLDGDWHIYNEKGDFFGIETYKNGILQKKTNVTNTNKGFLNKWVPIKTEFYVNGKLDDTEIHDHKSECIGYIDFAPNGILIVKDYYHDCSEKSDRNGTYENMTDYVLISQNGESHNAKLIVNNNELQMIISMDDEEGNTQKVIVYLMQYDYFMSHPE